MDVWRITVAALRRWYVLLPLLGLTTLLVLAAGRGVQPEYEVTGATLLVPGRDMQEVPNPYGGPAEANGALGIVLNSPEARQKVADRGLVPTYEVSPQSRSTVMNFRVRSDSPQQGIETGLAVFQLAAEELRDRQTAAGIEAGEQYSVDALQAPAVSAAVTDGKLRNMAVIAVLGGAISLMIAVFFDDVIGLVERNRRSRRRTVESAGPAPAKAAVAARDDAVPVSRPATGGKPARPKTKGSPGRGGRSGRSVRRGGPKGASRTMAANDSR